MKRLLIVVSVAAIAAGALSPAAAAAKSPATAKTQATEPRLAPHDLPNPLAEKQDALKATAREAVLRGEARPRGDNKVVKVAKGQFVELAFEGEDQILTLLAEFGSGVATHHGGHPGPAGPLHNQIPEPDRQVDNRTIWAPDFNPAYYENLLYNKGERPSMANWYLEASSGTYSVDGAVGDWVQVPDNAASYGSNYCGGIICADTWRFVNDQADVWWNALVAQTGSVTNANAWLSTFDVWDRYDIDGDGNFDEPDGYIDHFQSVHAGIGEESCSDESPCDDAIWSHRWYAYFPGSPVGPDGAGPHGLQGVHLGESNYWIGDYTVEPENGGVGVFVHEFGHDLNLPDEYDTSGNTGGAENSTAWWTTWSQGSYGTIDNEGIGNYPVSMDAWERFQLGFLHNFSVAFAGQSGTYHLGPVELNNKKPSALFVVLPDKDVTQELGAPFEGANFYYSGSADSLNTTMTRNVTLPAGASLSAKVRYNIEEGFDFAYVAVDGTPVDTSLSNSTVLAEGIEGISPGQPDWVDLNVDLSAFTGAHDISIGYFTDGGVQGQTASLPAGFAIDNIQISGQPLDGAETDAGWTFDSNQDQGFHVTTGTETFQFFNAYVVESRTYIGYDEALLKGPYNFGFPDTPNLAEHFPFQDGVLIWYWDDSFRNNNVGDHPGEGWILPVDAHPGIETWSDGTQMRPRIQSYDSTFTTKKTDAITLHDPATGAAKTISSKPAARVFDDSLRDSDGTSIYWAPGHPSDAPDNGRYQAEWNSVNVPNTGTRITVKSISTTGMVVLELN